MECDASRSGFGVVLMQEGMFIFFECFQRKSIISNKFMKRKSWEMLHEFITWLPHLIGRHFNIRTYHESVGYFLEQHLSSREHENWVTLMLHYEFEIIYKEGKQNVVVDGI